jgi:hypothetical protein
LESRHRLMLRPPGEADPWSAGDPPVAPPHVCRGRAPYSGIARPRVDAVRTGISVQIECAARSPLACW